MVAIFPWGKHLHEFHLHHHTAWGKIINSRNNVYVGTHILTQFIFFVIHSPLINLLYCIPFFYISSLNFKLFSVSICFPDSYSSIFLHFILHFDHMNNYTFNFAQFFYCKCNRRIFCFNFINDIFLFLKMFVSHSFLIANIIKIFLFQFHQLYIFTYKDICFT